MTPQVRAFIDSLPPGALLADVGCGNGKYFGVRPDLALLASDRSANLAEAAASRCAASAPTWLLLHAQNPACSSFRIGYSPRRLLGVA
jgi:hypothetical protein